MEFFTYNWPLMVMIMKLTMMACNDNEKLCSPIMIIIHLCFYVIIVARILNTLRRLHPSKKAITLAVTIV